MRQEIANNELLQILQSGDQQAIKALSEDIHPANLAEILAEQKPNDIRQILLRLPVDLRVDIFCHFDDEHQLLLAETLRRYEMAMILSNMPPDERVDLIKSLPEEKRDALLPALAQAEREDIRKLSAYEEGTAGSVMTSDYVTLTPELSAVEALAKLRIEAPDKETIYYCYVISSDRKLIGFVSLKNLILARPQVKVQDIMQERIIYARVDEPQEEAARKIDKYDLLALPVVDEHEVLIGIITYDDALDILNQAQTEDLEKFMAISGEHKVGAYLRTSVWQHFRNRSGWLVGLGIISIFSGYILHAYEATLESLLLLALYIPMIADSGGNAGSQSATVVIRALALQEIDFKDAFQVVFKEFRISILLCVILMSLAFAKVLFLSHGVEIDIDFDLSLQMVAMAIALALGMQVMVSMLIGSMLPLLATRFKFDPAVVASPLLTTLVDVTGLLIYFNVVTIFLGIT